MSHPTPTRCGLSRPRTARSRGLARARLGVDAPAQLTGVPGTLGEAKPESLRLAERGEALDAEERAGERREDRLVGAEGDRVLAFERREPGDRARDSALGHERVADDEAASVADARGDDLGGLDGANERAARDEREVAASTAQGATHARDRGAPPQRQ